MDDKANAIVQDSPVSQDIILTKMDRARCLLAEAESAEDAKQETASGPKSVVGHAVAGQCRYRT